jgi:hypothetical protein
MQGGKPPGTPQTSHASNAAVLRNTRGKALNNAVRIRSRVSTDSGSAEYSSLIAAPGRKVLAALMARVTCSTGR